MLLFLTTDYKLLKIMSLFSMATRARRKLSVFRGGSTFFLLQSSSFTFIVFSCTDPEHRHTPSSPSVRNRAMPAMPLSRHLHERRTRPQPPALAHVTPTAPSWYPGLGSPVPPSSPSLATTSPARVSSTVPIVFHSCYGISNTTMG